jgi:glycosyltransferase involved in cell wall biosynthesis
MDGKHTTAEAQFAVAPIHVKIAAIELNAIVVAHVCPFPKNKGNAARLLCFLEWLRSRGFRLTFVLQPMDVDDPRSIPHLKTVVDELIVVQRDDFRDRARRLLSLPARIARRLRSVLLPSKRPMSPPLHGVYTDLEALCWPATIRAVASAARRHRPDIVVSEFAFFSRCFVGLPASTIKIIDTHEVFSRNAEQFGAAGVAANLLTTRASESAALERADVVLAIQRDDAEFIRRLVPTKPVITVGHVYPEARTRASSPQRGVVLYVGSSNQYNRHGLELFAIHAWPTIRNAYPEAVLHIVGSARLSGSISHDGIQLLGQVDEEQLAQQYQTAHVVINPQVVGTGLKIKCVEALSAGCPLVVNRAGADGLREAAGTAFFVAEDWGQFAEHVVTILQNDALRLRLETAARRFAAERFSHAAVFAELEKFVEEQRARF